MPLLGDHQDPDGLAARVAFHCHRLGITATALRAIPDMTRQQARDIVVGRMHLRESDVPLLYQALQIPDGELTRPLNMNEQLDWAFYRTTARHPLQTWENVKRTLEEGPFSQRQLAELAGLDHIKLNKAINGQPEALTFMRPQAVRLAKALHIEDGPETFLANLPRYPLARDR